MSEFAYKALNSEGRIVNGVLSADSKDTAASHLLQRHLMPLSLNKRRYKPNWNISFEANVKRQALVIFTRQLQALLSAGVPLLESLQSLATQSSDETLQKVITGICAEIETGSSLYNAMKKHPRVFSELYLNSVHIGEISGTLDRVLLNLSDYLEDESKTIRNIKKAVRYPVFVMIALVMAFFVFIYFVIPKFMPVFEKGGQDLPVPTKIILALNTLFTVYWIPLLILLLVVVIGFLKVYTSDSGRLLIDGWLLQIPVYGSLLKKISVQRFSRTLALLNGSGIPLMQAMETVKKIERNHAFRSEINKLLDSVEKGSSIAGAMKNCSLFPMMMIHMVAVGEKSGSLDEMLENIAMFNAAEIEHIIQNLTSLIEPVVTAVLGIMVMFLALSIFMPMWNMLSIIK